MNLKEKLTFISIGFILITILFVSLSHSKDEAKQEQQRRSEMYKYIGDESS
mgnify:FL=1